MTSTRWNTGSPSSSRRFGRPSSTSTGPPAPSWPVSPRCSRERRRCRWYAEYAQDLLPDGLASAMPFAGSGVGDPGGMLLGYSLDGLLPRPVFLDPAHGPRDLNRSGSLAAIGELGAGKSFLAKTLAHNTVAMGGQVVAIDRTEQGEYGRLAAVVGGSAQVVEISADATVGLDPFAVFDTDELRLRYGVGFITLLTATPPGSVAGTHCYRAAQHTLERAAQTGHDRPDCET